MASELFSPPSPALDPNAAASAGAQWKFYDTGTLTPQPVYADADLGTSLGPVVTADSSGRFPAMYFDPALVYRAVLTSADGGDVIDDIDPVNRGQSTTSEITFTQAGAGAVERVAQDKLRERVTPQDFGAAADGVADDAPAVVYAIGTGQPITVLPGTYRLTTSPVFAGQVSWRRAADATFTGAGSITAPDLGGFFYFPDLRYSNIAESCGTPSVPTTDNHAVASFVKHSDAPYPGSGLIQPAMYVGHHKYSSGALDRSMGIYTEAIDHAGSDGSGESFVEGLRAHGIQLGADGLAYGGILYAQMGDGITDPGGRYTISLEADLVRPLGADAVAPNSWAAPDNIDTNVLATIRAGAMTYAGFMINPYNAGTAQCGFLVPNSFAATGFSHKLVNFASFCSIADDVSYGMFVRGQGIFSAISVGNDTTILRAANFADDAEHELLRYDENDDFVIGEEASSTVLASPVRHQLAASNAPVNNGDLTIAATSDTLLTFSYRGSDGVVRTGTMVVA